MNWKKVVLMTLAVLVIVPKTPIHIPAPKHRPHRQVVCENVWDEFWMWW